MITLRRATERACERHGKLEVWRTFSPALPAITLSAGFGILEALDEECLPPGASVPRHATGDDEVITYVREGALACEDSLGRSGVLHAGEFQRMITGLALRRSERNASRADSAQVVQMWFRPFEAGLDSTIELKRFSVAERSGVLCAVASPDGRQGSLRMSADALVFSAILDPGQHVVHALMTGRSAWLHVVVGDVSAGNLILTAGDGLGMTEERSVSLTAREASEILLLDLGPESSRLLPLVQSRRTSGPNPAL